MYHSFYEIVFLMCTITTTETSDDHQTYNTGEDGCQTAYVLPDSQYRGEKCPSKSGKTICDKYLRKNAWYRAENDVLIINEPVNLYECDTEFPIWMNGSFPLEANKNVERQACLKHATDCERQFTMKVKNCSGYYVYQFQDLPDSCEAAFCFGKMITCPPVDPCHRYFYETIAIDDYKSLDICNRNLSDGWYLLGKHEKKSVTLPAKCPKAIKSSNEFPVWVNHTSAITQQTTINTTLCVPGRHDCCAITYPIQIRNCVGYYVYRFAEGIDCQEGKSQEENNRCSYLSQCVWVYLVLMSVAHLLWWKSF